MKELVSSNKRRINPLSIYLHKQPLIKNFSVKVMSSGSCFASAIAEQFSELGIYSFFDAKTCCRFSAASFAEYFRYLSDINETKIEERLYVSGNDASKLIRSTAHAELCENHSNKNTLINTINNLNKEFIQHLQASDIIIFTLGTARYLKSKNSGQILNTQEGFSKDEFEVIIPTTQELLSDIKYIISSIHKIAKPSSKIFLTVSPQRYSWEPIGDFKDGRTATQNDYSSIPYDGIVSNCFDKSRLRVNLQEAIEELSLEIDNIIYFPSYEIVLEELRHLENFGIKENDYGHVSRDTSSYVVNRFLNAYMSEDMQNFIEAFKKNQSQLEHRFYYKTPEDFVTLIDQYRTILSENSELFIPSSFCRKILSAIERYKKNMDHFSCNKLADIKQKIESQFDSNSFDIENKCEQINKISKDDRVYIYGIGTTAEYLLRNSLLLKKNVQCFMQSQQSTSENYFGYNVYKIDDILIPENATIVIASIGSFEKIKETLKSNGLKSQKII